MDYKKYTEENTTRSEAGSRGGGIEIDVSELFGVDDAKISAYQNYLGGGMLGAICSNANFNPAPVQQAGFEEISEALKKYFHALTNHVGDEWEEASFEENQARPVSAY